MEHPNIVVVHGCATKYDHFVMVMEMLNQSLDDLLAKVKEQQEMQVKLDSGAITEDSILKRTRSVLNIEAIPIWHILRDVTLALQYLHKQKLMHRDIKPSNILLTRDYRAKLCDFGLVREVDPQGNMTNAGSSAYKAPEVIYGSGTYTTAVDIFSLGRVIEKDILPVMWSQPLRDLADWILQPIPGQECAYGDAKTRPTATNLLRRIDAMIKKHEAWWHPKLEIKRALTRDASGSLLIATPRPEPPYGNLDASGKPRPRLSIVLNADVIAEHQSPGRNHDGIGGLPPRAQSAPVLSPTKTVPIIMKPIFVSAQSKTATKTSVTHVENEPNPSVIVETALTSTENDIIQSPPKRPRVRRVQKPTARSRSGSTTVGESLPSSHHSTTTSDDEPTNAIFPSPIFLDSDDQTVYISPGGQGSFYHGYAHRSATRPYSFIKAVRLGFRPCSCAMDLQPPHSISSLCASRIRRPRTRSGLGQQTSPQPVSPMPVKATSTSGLEFSEEPSENSANLPTRPLRGRASRQKLFATDATPDQHEESSSSAMEIDEDPPRRMTEDTDYDEDLDEDFIVGDGEEEFEEEEEESFYGTEDDVEADSSDPSQSPIDEEVLAEEEEVSTLEIDDEMVRRPKQRRAPRSISAPIPSKRPKRH